VFTTHFKMTAHPFAESMPADRFLKDERIAQGLARLEYFATAGRLALITGPTGVGKSTLIKLFIASLSRNRYHPVYVYLTHVGANGLLKLIVSAMGEAPRHSKDRLFLQILDKTRQSEPTTLLVLDEAHLVEPQTLTDLRLLVSSVLEDGPQLKIVLSGQEVLRDQLKRSSHADLVHRISVRYHVPPMTREQTAAYIDHHMNSSGASDKVFNAEARSLIHDYGSGLPRQVNNLATACLINAAARNLQKITDQLVNETMAEFQLP
jgi:general secretion pathway protein A